MGFSDRRVFGMLALLSSFIDFQHHQFHIDHVFPKSRFTRVRLLDAGIVEDQIDGHVDCSNRIGNLQLLDGTANLEKRARLPSEWMEEAYPNPEATSALL